MDIYKLRRFWLGRLEKHYTVCFSIKNSRLNFKQFPFLFVGFNGLYTVTLILVGMFMAVMVDLMSHFFNLCNCWIVDNVSLF